MDHKVRFYRAHSCFLISLHCCSIADAWLGSILAVPAGRMRNNWYPNQIAEYVTKLQLKELGLENQVLERDPTYGNAQKPTEKSQEEEDLELQPESIKVDMGLLSVCVIVLIYTIHLDHTNALDSLNAH